MRKARAGYSCAGYQSWAMMAGSSICFDNPIFISRLFTCPRTVPTVEVRSAAIWSTFRPDASLKAISHSAGVNPRAACGSLPARGV